MTLDPALFGDFTTIGGIVAFTLTLVEGLKRVLATSPRLGQLPTWLYAVGVSAVLTLLAHYGLGLLQGDIGSLLVQAIVGAALAGGFKGWWDNLTKPLSASTAARSSRGEIV